MFRLHRASTGSLAGLKNTRTIHLGMNGHGYDNIANQPFRNEKRFIRTLSGPKTPNALVSKLPNIRQQSQDLAAVSYARSSLEARKFNPGAAALRTVLDVNHRALS